tara:strand:- start:226 stop:672 length:447 start_codon:yes stop_codon:yes gene_type:complete
LQEEIINLNLEGLKKFCEDVSLYLKKGDIICLSGDLGSGKTTFSRYLIKSIYQNQNKEPPNNIKSPSFPILLTYELNDFEIYHYDLYRVSNISDLIHLNILEELNNSITLVEWPSTILDLLQNYNYFSINFDILDENMRSLKHNLIFS